MVTQTLKASSSLEIHVMKGGVYGTGGYGESIY